LLEAETRADGQVIRYFPKATEKAGKPLKDCEYIAVRLTLYAPGDDEFMARHGPKALRRRKVKRICDEAVAQGAPATQEDLAALFGCHRSTIVRDIAEMKPQGIKVITRGDITDQGRGITHKRTILKTYLLGWPPTEVAKRTGHALESVERYIEPFFRVACLYTEDKTLATICRLTKLSDGLVKEYIALYTRTGRGSRLCRAVDQASAVLQRRTAVSRSKRGSGVKDQTAKQLYRKAKYGPAANKNIRAILRKELLTNFGFEHMFLMADVLIDRFLEIVQEADVIGGHVEPFQTVIYGYDKLKKFEFVHRLRDLHLRPARVSIVTTEEIARLRDGAGLPQLRGEMAVRILKEAYAQNTILSFADVGLVMCQVPACVARLVRQYREAHPGEFIPHCGSVLDIGPTRSHKREAILLYLQGHLTSEIARRIQHAPEDVDHYIYNYQRVVELAQEGHSVNQIGFLTNIRSHVVREYIALWKEFEAMKKVDSVSSPSGKEKEKNSTAEQD
jgi:biotin operon repressor